MTVACERYPLGILGLRRDGIVKARPDKSRSGSHGPSPVTTPVDIFSHAAHVVAEAATWWAADLFGRRLKKSL